MSVEAAVIELLPDPTVVVADDGRIRSCNVLAARLLGTTVDDVLGRPAAAALPLRDAAGNDWWACARPLEADPRLLPRVPETELSLTDRHGRERAVTLTAARHEDAQARLVVGLRGADRRRRLDAARSELISTVSHELRSPLTSVKGFTKTLLAKWDRFDDAQKQQMLRTVNEDADRVTRLLGELLDVSRIEAGRLQLRRRMVDVPPVVERVVARLALHEHARPLDVALPADLPQLYADPDKLEQIFTNLLENALKYGRGRVAVHGRVRTDEVAFTVSDEGEGIPAANLPHLFTKFFRRAGEQRSGTGLGLYITKGLVEAHGGRIWADSRPGEGSAFTFTLPRGGLELAGIDLAALRHDTRR